MLNRVLPEMGHGQVAYLRPKNPLLLLLVLNKMPNWALSTGQGTLGKTATTTGASKKHY